MDTGEVPTAIDKMWQLVIAMGTGIFTLFAGTIAHIHARISAVQRNVDESLASDRQEAARVRKDDEDRRAVADRDLWSELKTMRDGDRVFREAMIAKVAELPTRHELRDLLNAGKGNG